MGGDNMESLLLQNDDSSSGESDAEEVGGARQQPADSAVAVAAAAVVPTPVVTAPTAAALPQSKQPPTLQPQQQLPLPQTTKPPVGSSQSEMAARLKSMYSPATKSNVQVAKPPVAAVSAQAPPPTQVVPQQQQVSVPTQAAKPQPAPLTSPAQYHRGSSGGGVGTHPGAPMSQAQIPQPSSTHHRSQIASSGGIPHQMTLPQRQQQPGGVPSRPRPATSQSHQTTRPPAFAPRGGITQSSSAGGSKSQQQHVGMADPFEPTPVSAIIERSKFSNQQQPKQQPAHQHVQQAQQHVPVPVAGSTAMSGSSMASSSQRGTTGYHPSQQQPSGTVPGSAPTSMAVSTSSGGVMPIGSVSSALSGPTNTAQMSRAEKEREMKKYKERFLIFTRVLMKYLEQKDVVLHAKVKAIIKDCAERNKRQEPGYESVTASMRTRLKAVVHENYWKRAEAYLDHFLKDKAKSGSASAMALVTGPGGSSTSTSGGLNSTTVPTTSAIATTSSSGAYQDDLARRKQAMAESLRMQQQPQQPSSASSRPPQQVPVPPVSTQPEPTAPIAIQDPVNKKRGSVGSTASSQSGKPAVATSKGPTVVPAAKKASKARSSKATASAAQRKASAASASTPSAAAKQQQQQQQPLQQQQQQQYPVQALSSATVETPTSQQQAPTPVASAATTTPQQQPQQQPPPPTPKPLPPPVREYNEFMELVDHAVHYDWTVAGLLMEKEQPDILSREQKALLMETRTSISTPASPVVKRITTDSNDKPKTTEKAFPLPGWSKRNVLSSRTAWALLRLPEESALITQASKPNPVVGNGLLSLPRTGAVSASQPGQQSSPIAASLNYEHRWYNEEKAEEDEVLAVLSEGLQIYLRGVLEKAVHSARQRYNVDGIRLWHQQTAMALKAKAVAKESNKSNKDSSSLAPPELPPPPPLTLRLGCDVTRQVAQASGNAALTVKRMEEALERQEGVPSRDLFSSETETSCLLKASSMSELALLPKLAKAVHDADIAGKRSFEVYGGKYSTEPPLGRIPKQPKLEVVDFQMGMSFSRPGKRRNLAGTTSSSFFF